MSEFTVDYILNRAGNKYTGTNDCLGLASKRFRLNNGHPNTSDDTIKQHLLEDNLVQGKSGNQTSHPAFSTLQQFPIFNWLNYSRYHPPKLPRSISQSQAKRTPGRLPRIPFTPAQLHGLELSYSNSHYLSAEAVAQLAKELDLSNVRIKIWFQNRRARERREKREKLEMLDSVTSSITSSTPEPHSEPNASLPATTNATTTTREAGSETPAILVIDIS